MNKKDLILSLVNAGFGLEEALTMSEPDKLLEEPETAQETQPAPEAQPAPEPEAAPDPTPGTDAILKSLEELKKSIETMTDVTRATARLYGADGKKNTESADDILARLG